MTTATAAMSSTRTRTHFGIVTMFFLVKAISYADRATLSIAAPAQDQKAAKEEPELSGATEAPTLA